MADTGGSAGEVRVRLALDASDLQSQISKAENEVGTGKGIELQVKLSDSVVNDINAGLPPPNKLAPIMLTADVDQKTSISKINSTIKSISRMSEGGVQPITIPVKVKISKADRDLLQSVGGLAKSKGVDVAATATPRTRKPRRTGGSYSMGDELLVGEEGPEIIKMRAPGGTVIPTRNVPPPIRNRHQGGMAIAGHKHSTDGSMFQHPRSGQWLPTIVRSQSESEAWRERGRYQRYDENTGLPSGTPYKSLVIPVVGGAGTVAQRAMGVRRERPLAARQLIAAEREARARVDQGDMLGANAIRVASHRRDGAIDRNRPSPKYYASEEEQAVAESGLPMMTTGEVTNPTTGKVYKRRRALGTTKRKMRSGLTQTSPSLIGAEPTPELKGQRGPTAQEQAELQYDPALTSDTALRGGPTVPDTPVPAGWDALSSEDKKAFLESIGKPHSRIGKRLYGQSKLAGGKDIPADMKDLPVHERAKLLAHSPDISGDWPSRSRMSSKPRARVDRRPLRLTRTFDDPLEWQDPSVEDRQHAEDAAGMSYAVNLLQAAERRQARRPRKAPAPYISAAMMSGGDRGGIGRKPVVPQDIDFGQEPEDWELEDGEKYESYVPPGPASPYGESVARSRFRGLTPLIGTSQGRRSIRLKRRREETAGRDARLRGEPFGFIMGQMKSTVEPPVETDERTRIVQQTNRDALVALEDTDIKLNLAVTDARTTNDPLYGQLRAALGGARALGETSVTAGGAIQQKGDDAPGNFTASLGSDRSLNPYGRSTRRALNKIIPGFGTLLGRHRQVMRRVTTMDPEAALGQLEKLDTLSRGMRAKWEKRFGTEESPTPEWSELPEDARVELREYAKAWADDPSSVEEEAKKLYQHKSEILRLSSTGERTKASKMSRALRRQGNYKKDPLGTVKMNRDLVQALDAEGADFSVDTEAAFRSARRQSLEQQLEDAERKTEVDSVTKKEYDVGIDVDAPHLGAMLFRSTVQGLRGQRRVQAATIRTGLLENELDILDSRRAETDDDHEKEVLTEQRKQISRDLRDVRDISLNVVKKGERSYYGGGWLGRNMGGPLMQRLAQKKIQTAYDEGRIEEGQAMQKELEQAKGGWGEAEKPHVPEWRRRDNAKILGRAAGGGVRGANYSGGARPSSLGDIEGVAAHAQSVTNVGEHGPEAIAHMPDGSQFVVPNHQMAPFRKMYGQGMQHEVMAQHPKGQPMSPWVRRAAANQLPGKEVGRHQGGASGHRHPHPDDRYMHPRADRWMWTDRPGFAPSPTAAGADDSEPQLSLGLDGGSRGRTRRLAPMPNTGRSESYVSAGDGFIPSQHATPQTPISFTPTQQLLGGRGLGGDPGTMGPEIGTAIGEAARAALDAEGTGASLGSAASDAIGTALPDGVGPAPGSERFAARLDESRRNEKFKNLDENEVLGKLGLEGEDQTGYAYSDAIAGIRSKTSESLALTPVRALSVSIGQIAQTALGGRAGIQQRAAAANVQAARAQRAAGFLENTREQRIATEYELGSAQRQGDSEEVDRLSALRDKLVAREEYAEPLVRTETARAAELSDDVATRRQRLTSQTLGLAGIVGGTVLFSSAMQVAQASIAKFAEAAGPAIDAMGGFTMTAERTAKQLSSAMIGGTGGAAEFAGQQAKLGITTQTDALQRRSQLQAGSEVYKNIQDQLRSERNFGRRDQDEGVFTGFNNGSLSGIPVLGDLFGWIGQDQSLVQRASGLGQRQGPFGDNATAMVEGTTNTPTRSRERFLRSGGTDAQTWITDNYGFATNPSTGENYYEQQGVASYNEETRRPEFNKGVTPERLQEVFNNIPGNNRSFESTDDVYRALNLPKDFAQQSAQAGTNMDITKVVAQTEEQLAQIKEVEGFWGEISDNAKKVNRGMGEFQVTLDDTSTRAKETAKLFDEKGLTDVAQQIRDFGIEFTGNIEDVGKALDNAALGATFQDPSKLLQAALPQVTAQARATRRGAEFQQETVIPAQFATTLLKSPMQSSGAQGLYSQRPTDILGGMGDIGTTGQASLDSWATAIEGVIDEANALKATGIKELLTTLGVPQSAIDDVTEIAEEIRDLGEYQEDLQLGIEQERYNEQLRITKRNIGDLVGLNGKNAAAYRYLADAQYEGSDAYEQQVVQATKLGVMNRAQIDDQREVARLSRAQAMDQRELARISLARNQRELNLQLALSRLKAPGETPQERAVRRREAELIAREKQRELDINKRTTERGFGIEDIQYRVQVRGFKIQDIELKRQLDDALRQAGLSESEREITLELRGVGKFRQANEVLLQSKTAVLDSFVGMGTALEEQIMGIQAQIEGQSGQFLESFEKEVRQAFKPIKQEIRETMGLIDGDGGTSRPNPRGQQGSAQGTGPTAAGGVFGVNTATRFLAGEAGAESVVVLRGVKSGMLSGGPAGAGGGGGGRSVTINIIGAQVRNDTDIDAIAAKVKRAIHDEAEVVGVG